MRIPFPAAPHRAALTLFTRRSSMRLRAPQSFVRIQQALRDTPWETFAFLAALPALAVGLFFLLRADIYTVSKSYTSLAQWLPDPRVPGAWAVGAAALVLFALHRTAGRAGLLGVVLFYLLMIVASLSAVGFTGGLIIYLMFGWLALRGFVHSGGLGHRGH